MSRKDSAGYNARVVALIGDGLIPFLRHAVRMFELDDDAQLVEICLDCPSIYVNGQPRKHVEECTARNHTFLYLTDATGVLTVLQWVLQRAAASEEER